MQLSFPIHRCTKEYRIFREVILFLLLHIYVAIISTNHNASRMMYAFYEQLYIKYSITDIYSMNFNVEKSDTHS